MQVALLGDALSETHTSNMTPRVGGVEVEQAWARARRPGPKFWLTVNKPQA